MEYTVVIGNTYEHLNDQVNGMHDQGWKAQGGVCVQVTAWNPDNSAQRLIYVQAMIRTLKVGM